MSCMYVYVCVKCHLVISTTRFRLINYCKHTLVLCTPYDFSSFKLILNL